MIRGAGAMFPDTGLCPRNRRDILALAFGS
jgi:hypothetical protein